MNLVDRDGDPRIVIHTGTDGEPHLKLLGKERSVLFEAPAGGPVALGAGTLLNCESCSE